MAPAIVSPNGDGRGEKAGISYRLSTAAAVTATVQDVLDTTVASVFAGRRAAGKQTFAWSPSALRDGWYRLTLTAVAGGKQVQTTTRFWVDRTLAGLRSSAPAISPNGDGRLDTADLSFRLLGPAHVEVRILHGPEVVATLLEGDVPAGSQRVAWDGGGLADGSYTASVAATDSLLVSTQTVPVRIDRRAPVLRLVSLRTLIFRVNEPGSLVLAVNGRWRKVTVTPRGPRPHPCDRGGARADRLRGRPGR